MLQLIKEEVSTEHVFLLAPPVARCQPLHLADTSGERSWLVLTTNRAKSHSGSKPPGNPGAGAASQPGNHPGLVAVPKSDMSKPITPDFWPNPRLLASSRKMQKPNSPEGQVVGMLTLQRTSSCAKHLTATCHEILRTE